jgi:predicted nucleotidyltransferase
MNVGFPLGDVVPGATGQTLAALLRSARPLTTRELAEASGISHTQAGNVVRSLETAGLITSQRRGSAALIALNEAHLAVPHLRAIAQLRRALTNRLTEAMATWPHLTAAWLFGSTARGDGDETSDIDVLAVFDTGEVHDEAIGSLAHEVRKWVGNPLQLVEHTTESWRQMILDRSPLVESIRRDGIELLPGSSATFQVIQ